MPRINRVKFQWATARETPGDWYLGLVGLYQSKGRRGRSLAISLRGLLSWCAVFAAAGYCAVAGYVWWKLEKRPYNYVTYVDMLLYPVRKQHIEELRGQATIAEGMDELKARRWQSALMKLRIGLDKYPRDNNARLQVARFFLGSRLRTRAQETLMRGLDFGWPGRAYLQSALDLAQGGEDHELVMEICDRALSLDASGRATEADLRWLVEQRARATLAAGQHEELIAYVARHRARLGVDTSAELDVLALIETGRLADAERAAAEWYAAADDKSRALRLLARVRREAGKREELAASLEELRRMAPADPRLTAFAIVQTLLVGDTRGADRLLDDYVFRFGGTPANFALLAQPLAEIGRLAELDRLIAAASERGMNGGALGMARLQALFANARWVEARAQAEELRASAGGKNSQSDSVLQHYALLAGAAADPSEAAQSSFTDGLRGLQLSLRAYRQAIEILQKAGRIESARQVIVYAEGVFPDNAYLVRARKELDVAVAAKREADAQARPVVASQPAFGTAEEFFAAVEAAERAGEIQRALTLVRATRRARPAWLDAQREPVDRAELRLAASADDVVALQSTARAYLTANDEVRVGHVVALATRLHEASRKSDARILLDEILRVAPAHAATLRLRDAWFPPAKTPAPAAKS